MTVQTLIVSNRNVKRPRNKGITLFGDQVNKVDDFRVASAEAMPLYVRKKVRHQGGRGFRFQRRYNQKPYSLTLLEKGQETLGQFLGDNHNGKPWLFFVHGNNQTFKKNLMKSRVIQEKYDVNMVIFSWPSRSFDSNIEWYILKAILFAVLQKSGASIMSIKAGLEQQIRQYRNASTLAGQSVGAFIDCFDFLRDNLFTPLKTQHPDVPVNMLVHSLGHKILRLAVESQKLGGFHFDNVLLHHADTPALGYQDWLSKLQVAQQENINIAVNQADATLFLSDMQQNLLPANGVITLKVAKQLGSYINYFRKQEYLDGIHRTRLGNHLDDGSSPFNIIDVTGRENVGSSHESAWEEDAVDALVAEYKAIIG